ncbi:MAG: carboxypeptidase M32, partial [Candidatus Kapaibacterium sp.]
MFEVKNKSLLYQEVLDVMNQIRDLESVSAVLGWDLETHMPDGAHEHRGDMISAIDTFAHRILTSAKTRDLADKVRTNCSQCCRVEEKMYDLFLEEFDRAAKIPDRLVMEVSRVRTTAQNSWKSALKKSNFKIFESDLEKLLDLKIEVAECLGYDNDRYDAMLNIYEPGLTVDYLDSIFDELRSATSELIERVKASDRKIDQGFFLMKYSQNKQSKIARQISRRIGFNYAYGRMDFSVHPFTTAFSPKDVRFTTRIKEHNLGYCFFSTIHEAGHAIYEQGIDYSLYRTFAAQASSYGIHESQSLIWENNIARSVEFWEWALPVLNLEFPHNLQNVTPGMAFRAVNKIRPSLIRTESDELTYNMHIILRYEIERDLMNKRIRVADIPEIWREKMLEYLGSEVSEDAKGALQDIHWAFGGIGYFPTY